MITLAQKYAALEALGYDCDTTAGEITTWRDARPQPATWEEIIEAGETILEARAARAQARAALADQWATLPAWIRGPFGSTYTAAIAHLDAGDDEAAASLIEYAVAPTGYDAGQVEAFELIRSSLLAGIQALPGD